MKQEPTVKQTNSYQWPSIKTIRDIADAYSSVYEKKEYETSRDKDEDGDNDFADNMIARMVASGMSREEAIKKVKNKDYNKKDELDEGIGSAIRGLFSKPKPKPSRGEELRSKYGSLPDSRPSRYEITLKSSGEEAAKKVLDAGGSRRHIHPIDDGSHKPGTVTSGELRGMGNRANRRMGKPPEDTRDRESEVAMGIESKVKRGHIDSRGVKKPIARINADFEMWVDGLLNEGYDLSEYTWDEMSEIYFDEATAMSKRGYDEAPIRNKIASQTRGGEFADKATALADKETYGDKKKKEGREKLARTQRGDFRNTTSSSPGLRGYGYKSDDPEVKAKQDARGNQRGRAALTPNERKQLNMEYDLYDLIQSHLLEYGFADTEEGANMIIENMSQSWIKQILSED